ncbi:eukaryotic translation initiation factor 2 subunit beta [Microthyrium microscopicum]|uniref:Eukaryotic translation initiation factor 2 subunit beta n=1 Tax=Microthyrium microscopicum TaxID=703497 RepID=A0A6A6UT39_9PEZI|nr:eukaryotic translation initiation factor 2 subunit beta [Microthyrium microscopicum]
MADVSTDKKRKSVAFSEGATVVAQDGTVSETADTGDKNTAENHSATGDDAGVEEVTDLFKDLAKKKKKKVSKPKEDADADTPTAEGDDLDLSALTKKKKKKKPKADDFEAALAEAGETGEASEGSEKKEATQEGDMMEGTGIFEHDNTEPILYKNLLGRFFTLLHDRHPDLAGASGKNYKIPPPQCLREGNKKTIFANIPDIAKRLKRSDEHITQFLFAELGTNGSVDGSRRLVIKGRFQSKQIENVLRRYIQDYVSCKTCRGLNTTLQKGDNRLWYLTCQSCGSTRTVPAIKTGFSAQIGKRKRMQT